MHDKVITICKRHCCPNCANKSKIILKMQKWKTFSCFGWQCGCVVGFDRNYYNLSQLVSRTLTMPGTPKRLQWCPKYWHCLLDCSSALLPSLSTMALCKWSQFDKCASGCVGVCVQRDSLYNLFTDCHQFWVKLRISSQMSNWLTDGRLTWPMPASTQQRLMTPRDSVCVCVYF